MPSAIQKGPSPRGRGAQSNTTGRFESLVREAFDDGWTAEDAAPAQLKTYVTPERSKTIIARNNSPDIGFDRSINPYRGCEHGCIYCYARPSSYACCSGSLARARFREPHLLQAGGRAAAGQGTLPAKLPAGADPHRRQHRPISAAGAAAADHPRRPGDAAAVWPPVFSIITKSALIMRDADIIGPMGQARPRGWRSRLPRWTGR